MKNLKSKAFETRAVHAGETDSPRSNTPISPPLFPSVCFTYEKMDDLDAVFSDSSKGFVYSRYANPTVTAFESAIAILEEAEAAQAYSSGMAAVHASLLSAGAKNGVVGLASLDLYGATYTLLKGLFSELGIHPVFVDATDLTAVENSLKTYRPAFFFIESISNPLLKVADLPSLAKLTHHYGTLLLVDNTFASPYLVNPLHHGADYVIHSATKVISGHGDVMAGVVATSAINKTSLFELNKLVGSVLGPFEAWLALRGLKTLPLRQRQQCQNAQQIAEWLLRQPRVSHIYYPGLPNHPQHDLAGQLFGNKGFGGVLSFEIADADKQTAYRFMDNLQVCFPATSLGDIYSLILHPATSSHRSLSTNERLPLGISDGLVRLSVGIEAVEDIQADLEQAFDL